MSDFIFLGERASAPEVPSAFPTGYARLMQDFGPGDFVDGLVLLHPGDVCTLAERVPNHYEDLALSSLVAFATTSGGGFFCWNPAAQVVFVPRSATRLSDVEEVCEDVSAWPNEVLDSRYTPAGLEHGFFIPQGSLREFVVWQAEAPDPYPTVHARLQGAFEEFGFQLLGRFASSKVSRIQFATNSPDTYVAAQTVPQEIRGRSKFNTRARIRHAPGGSLDRLRQLFAHASWSLE